MEKASSQTDPYVARRHYRVSVFCAISSVEAFANYVGDAFAQSDSLEPYEIAFLTDRQFVPSHGKFTIADKMEYHRLEDKLRYLVQRFVHAFDFEKMSCWSRLIEFKKFRDALTHPRQDEDETSLEEYKRITRTGLSSVIEMIDHLCRGIFKRPLRKKLLDLKTE